jgi:hypothetical protein
MGHAGKTAHQVPLVRSVIVARLIGHSSLIVNISAPGRPYLLIVAVLDHWGGTDGRGSALVEPDQADAAGQYS